MKKIVVASIFIFLTGLFTGLFFSMGLSDESNGYLSTLLISGITDSSAGFFRLLVSSLTSNLILVALMLVAIVTKLLCPLPALLLWYKSFAIGFCSSLIYISAVEHAFLISLTKILPANLLLIPGFIALTAITFHSSATELTKVKRPSREKESLRNALLICIGVIFVGCVIESLCFTLGF